MFEMESCKAATRIGTALFGLLAGCVLLTPPTLADGDPEAGKQRAITCAACHGADGNSVNPEWPSLAGQNERYFRETLLAFKSGKRSNPLMTAQAMLLNDTEIENLGAYYASQKAAQRSADPQLAAKGERLYRGGNKDSDVSACIACHGPTGRGNAPAGYPALTGQHATYTAKQLNDYKSGARTSDGDRQIMRNITAQLTADQIKAVAAYIQGLR
jgi:cytochrome c553